MTSQMTGGIWIKLLVYLVSTILVVTVWVWFATITVKWKDRAQEFGQSKLLQARSWVLDKLDAPSNVVISNPESQASLDQIIDTAAAAKGINPVLIRSLIKVESNWNQSAIGFNPHLEGKHGKMVAADHSYMQVSGRWANSELCSNVKNWSDLYDARKNIECGTAILKDALDSSKSTMEALSMYNSGRTQSERGQQYASKIALELVNNMDLRRK